MLGTYRLFKPEFLYRYSAFLFRISVRTKFFYKEPTKVKERNIAGPTTSSAETTQSALE
jgi:hypothetical protein